MILFLSENCLRRIKCDHFCIRTPSLGKTLPFDKSVNRYENISARNILHKSITFSDKHKIFFTLFDWIHWLLSHSKTHSSCHVGSIFYGNLFGKSMTFWKYRMDADAELHNIGTFYRSSSVLELFSTEPIKFLRHSVFS